jgi:hypothetical protein
MKKSLLLVLCCITSMLCNAQIEDKNKITYITGTPKVSEYSIKTCVVDASIVNVTNQAPAPILQFYIASKQSFIGQNLIDEKGKVTKITDIKIESSGKDNIFTVVGKKFSRGFILSDGFILLDEKNTIIFYTEGVGVWKVNRKI